MSEVLAASVAAEVRAHMARQQVNQQRIAEVLGYSRQAFSRRMTGEVPFDVAELEKIATFLNVPVTSLLAAGRAA
jgi:transcriptional regulator with XRE-family HTH domain